MKKSGMVLIDKGPLQVRTLSLESQWEVRTGVRLNFNVIRTQETRIPRIVEAEINGEHQIEDVVVPVHIDIKYHK